MHIPGYLLKKFEIYGPAFKIRSFVPSTGKLYDKMFVLPFSGEKHVKLFRRALLELSEGSKPLAPTASTSSISGFCAAVDTVMCVLHVYPT